MTPEEYARFIELYEFFRSQQKHRTGQAVFNAAHAVVPKKVNALWGTSVDPFYDDSRVVAFLEALGEPPF